jgi:4,5-dihydroxyphthalate decarboxylase
MVKPISLCYGGEIYDRTRPLYSGAVTPEGIDFRYIHAGIEDLFWRQGRYGEFDVSEYSFGAYLASIEDPNWGYVALPVFPSRAFRHSSVYVNSASGISSPIDLNGRIVGTPEWSMTASLWMRGILGEYYGVDLSSIRWRTGGLEESGRREKSRVTPPARFDVKPLAEGRTLNTCLVSGEIEALISARPPSAHYAGDSRIRRLFADPRSAERDFFSRSRIFPIMHLVIMRKALVAAHPWLANTLREAFERARRGALKPLLDTAYSTTSLAWESSYAEEEQALLGDAFSYGVEENRNVLNALCGYAFDQGFTTRRLDPEELFVPSTVTSARV